MPPHPTPARPTGRIIVRFSPSVTGLIVARAEEGLATLGLPAILDELHYDALLSHLGRYSAIRPSLLVSSARVVDVLRKEELARHSEFYPLHSLLDYWVFDGRRAVGRLEPFLQGLRGLEPVEQAYLERDLSLPSSPDLTNEQGYVEENEGVSARWAWLQGYRGAGVGFFHLDMMWNLLHEDLNLTNLSKAPPDDLLYGDNYAIKTVAGQRTCGYHGTEVLGTVLGNHNAFGVDGIAPDASPVGLVSYYGYVDGTPSGDDYWDVVNAVVVAIMNMQAGDVLLLEVQTADKFPIEVSEHCFNAIRLASALGIAVIEPAGNGGMDLDADQWSQQWGPANAVIWPVRAPGALTPGSAAYVDSGAIMVGGSKNVPHTSALPLVYRRWISAYDASNYGERVNCYAWGEGVCTTGGTDMFGGAQSGDPYLCNQRYTRYFGGTSAASAIIAGVAILVQEMYGKATGGAALSPPQLRTIMSDPANGTDQEAVEKAVAPIGIMPDLKKIASRLSLSADIYVRDRIGDLGLVPNALVYQSPDIFVRDTQNINAQALYGEGSGTENQTPVNIAVAANSTYHVYVRLRNRGGADAPDALAHVYWSDASALVAPVDWHLIGSSAALQVPADGTLQVAGPIIWDTHAGNFPATGHGCFVAVVHATSDPAPPLLPAVSPVGAYTIGWSEFLTYVGASNNVAWRNFTVVGVAEAEDVGVAFVIRGTPDLGRRFDLVIDQQLPAGAKAWLVVPMGLGALLSPRGAQVVNREKSDVGLIHIPPRAETTRFSDVYLGRRARYLCRLRFEGLRESDGPATLSIRQFYEGTEVGRLTWSFSDADDSRSTSHARR